MAGYIPTWLGRVEHLIEVGREVHGKSRRAVTLSSGKMSATMVSVTLGAIPWASCARYVRCTRTDFPPQTRPPFQSSRRCVAGTVKFVKSRNSSLENALSRECEKLDADITPRSHPCGGTGCRHGGRCVEPVELCGAGSGTIPRSPPIRRRPPLVSIPIRHHLISMSALTAAPPVPPGTPAPPRRDQLRLGTAALARCLLARHHQTLAKTKQIQIRCKYKY